MTLLFYISHSSKLTEEEKLDIDKSVLKNREAVIKFVKKMHHKGKVSVFSTEFGIFILVSTPKNASDIGFGSPSMHQAPIMKDSTEVIPTCAILTVKKQDKITLIENERVFKSDQIHFDLSENRISTIDTILELRSGDISPLVQVLLKIIWIWAIGQGHMPTEGLKLSGTNPGFSH